MAGQATLQVKIEVRTPKRSATYFELVVEIIDQMPNCTLVRYRDREVVVDTEDLVSGAFQAFEETSPVAS